MKGNDLPSGGGGGDVATTTKENNSPMRLISLHTAQKKQKSNLKEQVEGVLYSIFEERDEQNERSR